jgi:hypothetical protein
MQIKTTGNVHKPALILKRKKKYRFMQVCEDKICMIFGKNEFTFFIVKIKL